MSAKVLTTLDVRKVEGKTWELLSPLVFVVVVVTSWPSSGRDRLVSLPRERRFGNRSRRCCR